MNQSSEPQTQTLEALVDLVGGLNGVIEVKLLSDEETAWIGLRPGRHRPATALLNLVRRAAIGFGIDIRSVHFGILAD